MLEGSCHCGLVTWRLDAVPASATACNCSICHRYGVLWAYGHIDHDIQTEGETRAYRQADRGEVDFHFCGNCGCVTHYIAVNADQDGRHWTAVNLRLADADRVAALPIDHFDGLNTFEDLPADGRTVKDMWF